MKAMSLTAFGLENLTCITRPEADLSPHDVRVRVRAASLNYRDWMMVKGLYNPRQPLPLVPLSDGAGEVTAVGSAVTRVRVGDRVCGLFAQDWQDGPHTTAVGKATLGGPLDGMACESIVLPETGVARFAPHLSFAEASTLPCAGVTAYHAVAGITPVGPGDTVLVLGTGGVSIFALQIAKARGARVIVTSSSDAKLEKARALGADETINYNTDETWHKTARRMSGGGVDLVVEVGGAGTFERSCGAVRTGGTIAMIGVLSGAKQPIALTPVLMRGLRVQGVMVGHRGHFDALNTLFAAQNLRPVVDGSHDLDALSDALAAFKTGQHFGKRVVQC